MRRTPKDTDQGNVEIAYRALLQMIRSMPEIEASIWFTACMSVLAEGCRNSGVTHEEFCEVLDNYKEHYSQWFKE